MRAEIASRWQPEEVLPQNFLRGKSVTGADDTAKATRASLEATLIDRTKILTTGRSSLLSAKEVRSIVASAVDSAETWLESDDRKTRYPGRRVLETFSQQNQIGKPFILSNSIIREPASQQRLVDSELKKILKDAAKGKARFSS